MGSAPSSSLYLHFPRSSCPLKSLLCCSFSLIVVNGNGFPIQRAGRRLLATAGLMRALHLVLTTFNWLTIPHLRMVNAGILTPLDFGTGCSSESTLRGNRSRKVNVAAKLDPF